MPWCVIDYEMRTAKHTGPFSRYYVGCGTQRVSSEHVVMARDYRDSYHMNHTAIHLLFLVNA
jgi:hypothetical protein